MPQREKAHAQAHFGRPRHPGGTQREAAPVAHPVPVTLVAPVSPTTASAAPAPVVSTASTPPVAQTAAGINAAVPRVDRDRGGGPRGGAERWGRVQSIQI